MRPDYISDAYLKKFIESAFAEDVGDGDHSSLACIPPTAANRAKLLVKDEGVIAGIELARQIFKMLDPSLEINLCLQDGDRINNGDIAFTVHGSSRSILTAERLVLNCMQRMSGIATKTASLKQLVAGTNVQLLDTRKTTPNFRLPEKWAVLIGGGTNHRIGLYDMIMLKDNHIDMAGGIRAAINRTKDYLRANKRELRIEIETRNLKEVQEVIDTGGVDIIMLDNMSPEEIRKALKLINGKFKTEASGGITEKTIKSVAQCGVDYISVGALTHSVKSLDMSLKKF